MRARLIDIQTYLRQLQIARRATSPPHGLIGTLLDAHYDDPSFLSPFLQVQLLLHELNQRIGNEFCCAVSVVSLAAARSSDKEVKAVLTEVAELLTYAEVIALQMPEHGIRTDVAAYSSQAVHGEGSKRAAGLVGLQSPRAAEIGCDQVEGRAVRAD